ncbi:hypothetical protein [Streptomyces sp. KR80]|uniref:hypothetical protein n=1 Tax=Streptomyces sp. KR80 TaxID=3457426 RepID=UPI003FD3EF52
MCITRNTVSVLLVGGMTAAALLTGPAAYAAKKFYSVSNKAHTKATLVVADKKTNRLYDLSGDYTAPKKGGTYYMRKIVKKPHHKAKPWGGWKKAKYVGEISHVYRTEWDFDKSVKFPDGTKIYVQIKAHGHTPAFAI